MKNTVRRIRALEEVFRVPEVVKPVSVVIERALERLETDDLLVLQEIKQAHEAGALQSLTADQASVVERWTAVLEEESRNEGYASFKELERTGIC